MTNSVIRNQLMNIVIDSSVLINFLKIDRMDLLANHSCRIIATNHVSKEISRYYRDQRQRFAEAIRREGIAIEALDRVEEAQQFMSLMASGSLGAGECSAIALAVNRGFMLAMDDRKATVQALCRDQTLHILTTKDLIVSMIGENLLDIVAADQIKEELATKHRHTINLSSFGDICE